MKTLMTSVFWAFVIFTGVILVSSDHGVGEVISVNPNEYTELLRDSLNGNVTHENGEEDEHDLGLSNVTIVTDDEEITRSSGGGGGNPGHVDRNSQHAHEPQDLSFTGLLNGLLDSFINDSPPSPSSPPDTPQRSPIPTGTSTTPASLEDPSIEEPEDDEEEEEEPVHLDDQETNLPELSDESPDQNENTPQQHSFPNKTQKACGGECRNIIFGLFLCDEIDNDSFCPESLACCVNNAPNSKPVGNTSSEEDEHVMLDNNHDLNAQDGGGTASEDEEDDEEPEQPTASNPVQEIPRVPATKPNQPPPPPPPPPPQNPYMYNRVPPYQGSPYAQFRPPHHYPPPPAHHQKLQYACPRYCVKNHLTSHCPDRLPYACGVDAFCCVSNVLEPTLPPPQPEEEDEPEEHDTASDKQNKVLGPCTEEIGSCVNVHVINIICFAHATPTTLYTCPRSTMKCCARKTALPKDVTVSSTTIPPPVTNPITRNASSIIPKPPASQPLFALQQPEPPKSPVQHPQTRIPINSYVCGVKGPSSPLRRRKRVVGGRDSSPGEWCWQVALINSLNQYLCGGALIGTQWVLTAAHCVTNIVRSGDAIYIRVGDHDLTSRYGSPGAQTLRVATTYIHHNHNSQTLDNDIALLKLERNAALKEGVCLVCLPSRTHTEVPGKRCTVTGYGYMGESGPIPLRIREALLPIVSDDECVKKVNAVTEKVFALPMSSFCAGGDQSGHDACQGDGGGPLVCTSGDDRVPGYYELTGLVSWGFGCGRENVPGVYVKVSSFIGWIHQIIRSN